MRGCFAFRAKMARLQATDCDLSGHLVVIKSLLGAIDTRYVASIATHGGASTIQIAIAGGTG